MRHLLLAILFLQAATPRNGFVTGVVLSGSGVAAAGVRVYAVPAGDPNVAAVAGTVFVGLVQSDGNGRYRLEIPAGRYYIAAGSVESPTYYPNESSIASARVVSVSSDATVPDVNFSRFIPATSPPIQRGGLPAGSTGLLSGIIHFPDGSPAAGIPVAVVPMSVLTSVGAGTALSSATMSSIRALGNDTTSASTATAVLYSAIRSGGGGIRGMTDSSGRFRIDSVSPDTYCIVAGYADAPVFYPGSGDYKKAGTITTNPGTRLDSLHFNIPAVQGNVVRIRVLARANRPLPGATLELTDSASVPSGIAALLPKRIPRPVVTGADGFAEFSDVPAGRYTLGTRLYPASTMSQVIDVQDRRLNVEFVFPLNVFSGRVLWMDGTPVADAVLSQVAVRTLDSTSTSVFSISKDGLFNGILSSNEYRFFIRNLPQEFQIQSITSGKSDLAREVLKFSDDIPTDVEVRVARKANAASNVSGRVVDASTGAPLGGDRVQICCFSSRPFERTSTEVRSDGTFEFSDVPPGQYEMELKLKSGRILNPDFELRNSGPTRLNLYSVQQRVNISTVISTDGTVRWPQGVSMTVTFVPTSKEPYSISASGAADETFSASVPMGVSFDVSISNPPAGTRVKSVSGPDSKGRISAVGNSSILILLTRSD